MTERRIDYLAILERIEQLSQQREEADVRRWDAYMGRLSEILKAFPEDDPQLHRRLHEVVLEKEENKAKMYQEIWLSVYRWGIIGTLTWLVYLISSWLSRTPLGTLPKVHG